MKLRPIAWVLVLIGLVAPVVVTMALRSDNRPPVDRYDFLEDATLANYYPATYTSGYRFQRGNSYVFRLREDWHSLKKELDESREWKHLGTTRRGSEVYRHSDGPRIYVSRFVTDDHPESRSRIYLVDSVRRVGWIERQVASAWFRMQAQYLQTGL